MTHEEVPWGDFPRKADGRRIFSAEFKRELVQEVLRGEKTLAELSREYDISPTIIRDWKRRNESGAATAVKAGEDVVPASELQAAQARIREIDTIPQMDRCLESASTRFDRGSDRRACLE